MFHMLMCLEYFAALRVTFDYFHKQILKESIVGGISSINLAEYSYIQVAIRCFVTL